jgi:hypothetical protein
VVGAGFQTAGLAQCVAQHVFDLRVERTQLVVRPPLHRVQHRRFDAQRVSLLVLVGVRLHQDARCCGKSTTDGRF